MLYVYSEAKKNRLVKQDHEGGGGVEKRLHTTQETHVGAVKSRTVEIIVASIKPPTLWDDEIMPTGRVLER